jgi:hypothetical protein
MTGDSADIDPSLAAKLRAAGLPVRDVVVYLLGLKSLAAKGSVSAAETARFSRLVQAAGNHEFRDQAQLTGACATFRRF